MLKDLPEGVVGRLVGKSGYYCMQIHTKADIWNMAEMEQFVGQLRAVDDRLHAEHPAIDTGVTGNPVQVYESSREMMWGYEKGALYGVLIVILVVWLDFRSIRMTLLAILPLVTSKLQLFGLMGLLGIPLNPANMIVLPLILGIGVDTGVQIVHDYLREPRPYRMPPSTSAALVINTLMNIVGFGADDRLAPRPAQSGPRAHARNGLLPLELPGHAQPASDSARHAAEAARGRVAGAQGAGLRDRVGGRRGGAARSVDPSPGGVRTFPKTSPSLAAADTAICETRLAKCTSGAVRPCRLGQTAEAANQTLIGSPARLTSTYLDASLATARPLHR